MALSMGAFSIEDMFIKKATAETNIGLVLALFGLGGMLVFMLLTLWRKEPIFPAEALSKAVLVRAVFEIIGRLFFILAITFATLSSASAILQATPLIVMIGAVFFFKEKIDGKRWIAVFIGFLGVLLIIRPGLESFEIASVTALIATLGFAGRDLATRAAKPVLSNVQLGVYGFLILIPTGVGLLFFYDTPIIVNRLIFTNILAAVGFGVFAYNALTIAMRCGDVSVVSPFRYTRLLFALIIGIFIFQENPDWLTLLGSLLIVTSGGYTLIRTRK